MGMQALAPAIQAQREKGADSTANWEEAHSHLRCLFHTEQLKRLIIGNTDEGLAHWIEDVMWFLQSSDSHKVKKFASKLHVHSVNFAAKLVHTRRALSSTVVNSHQELVSGQACNPPDPHWFFLFAVEELYGTRYQNGPFSLINVGSGIHCLRSYFLFFVVCASMRERIHSCWRLPERNTFTRTGTTFTAPIQPFIW